MPKSFRPSRPAREFQTTDQKAARVDVRAWRNLRNFWLRHHPLCSCGRVGEVVHHVVPREQAPHRTLDATNLRTMCGECHDILHGKIGSDFRKK